MWVAASFPAAASDQVGGSGPGGRATEFEVAVSGRCLGGSGEPAAGGIGGEVGSSPDWSMLSFTGNLKVFVAVEACDLRKGFNGLHALVAERLNEDLKSGALFVFSNRRHTRLKIIYWDGTGIWLLTKRLEAGTFFWPRHLEAGTTKLK